MSYAELQVTSNFGFLEGGSHPGELVATAAALGHAAIAISVLHPRQVAWIGKPTRYSCPRAKRRCIRPSRQTPSNLVQRVQRHSELEVVGLVFAAPDQLVGAARRGVKGVDIQVLL